MPHAGHFKVKSAAKRNRMARNKARGQMVSDEQIADNWDKIFNKSKQGEKIMDGLIFIIIVGVVVGWIILKTEKPNTYEKVKTQLQTYWENLRTYFK